MASSSIHHPLLAGGDIRRTLEGSSPSRSASYCSDDAFVPVFRPDPSAPSASAAAAAVDRVRRLFSSVDAALFRDAILAPAPGGEDLGFTEVDAEADYDGDLTSICWDRYRPRAAPTPVGTDRPAGR